MKHFLLSLFALALLCTGCNQSNKINLMEYKTSNPEGMQQVCDFLSNCGYYFIATTEGNQPDVRPFGTINIFEGKLYIQTGHSKNVAKQIAANPKIAICAYNGKQWIRIYATLVDDERIEAKKAMLDAYPSLRSSYNENDENTAVYALTNAKARLCSFVDEEVIIEF